MVYRISTSIQMLTEIDLSEWVTPEIESTKEMFHACYELSRLDIPSWNDITKLSAKTDSARLMFMSCDKLKNIVCTANVQTWLKSFTIREIGINFNSSSIVWELVD